MLIFLLVTHTLFVIACTVLGVRLLRLSRRSRQLPELLIGGSLLLGALSIACWWLDGLGVVPAPYGAAVGFVGRLTTSLATASIAVLAWRVFHPRSAFCGVAVGYLLALLSANFVREVMPEPSSLIVDPLWWGSSFAQAFAYYWLAWASFSHQRFLKRRARIGLPVDHLLALRMALWGVAMGGIGVGHTAVVFSEAWNSAIGPTYLDAPILGLAGLTCTVTLWLAFFTPRSWQARLAPVAEEVA